MDTVPEKTTYAKQISVEDYNQQKDDYTQKALKELNEQMKTFTKPETNPRTLITSNKKLSLSLPNSDNDDEPDDYVDTTNTKNTKNNDNNSDSDSDYANKSEMNDTTKSNSSLNFIIKHYVNEQTPPQQQLLKKRKITNTNKHENQSNIHNHTVKKTNTMSDAIYAQHELDMDVITNIKLKNNTLKIENEDLDTKKHFLTLELSNAQCEISDLKKQILKLKDVNIKLKQYINFMKKHDDDFDYYLKVSCYIIVLLMILVIYIFW
jgi:hypothetical protein